MNSRDLLYFVGSVPLSNADEVFHDLAGTLGDYLKRMPDGETGERLKWIVFQQRMLMEHPSMEEDPTQAPLKVRQCDGTVLREIKLLRLKLDVDPEAVTFDTGYDRAAISAYEVFARLKSRGDIPAHIRFQFALPTPLASGLMYVSPVGRERYIRAYERAILAALDNILKAIPHPELSIQFDVCQEVLLFENYFPTRIAEYKSMVFDQFNRLGAHVPAEVELGFHLCYGSPGDQPLLMLNDAGVLVELIDGIVKHIRRQVDFIHIPVPKGADDAFFAPMRGWKKPAGMQLYLGLLQFNDVEGDRRRTAAARRVLQEFGIAAECGFGRTDPRRVPDILAGHKRAAVELQEMQALK